MASLDTLRTHLRGVTAFPITPFHANLDLNLDGLRHNVDWMIRHGIVTLVAAGGTGELYSLTTEETEAVHRTVIEAAAGRAAVICGVGGKQRESQQLAATAEKGWPARLLCGYCAVGPHRGAALRARLGSLHSRDGREAGYVLAKCRCLQGWFG